MWHRRLVQPLRTLRCGPIAAGTTSVNAIDFSKVITATDKDGDTVIGAAAGKFTVAVQDDVPIANPGAIPVTASVEEDGMAGAATDDC